MSKSLKNFITIDQALEDYSSRQLRFAFLQQSWRATFEFSPSGMQEIRASEAIIDVSLRSLFPDGMFGN